MSQSRDTLINQLSQRLEPVNQPGQTTAYAVRWLTVSVVFAVGLMLFLGPFRPGWPSQLFASPQFMVETVAGCGSIMLLASLIFKLGIPGYPQRLRLIALAMVVGSLWLGLLLFGLYSPALDVSMLGKREHCYLEVVLYSWPPIIYGCYLLRRLLVTEPVLAGAIIGVCASAIPAWLMQFACMYSPSHGLIYHFSPMLLGIPAGIGASYLLLKYDAVARLHG
jgi:hypothetical protein